MLTALLFQLLATTSRQFQTQRRSHRLPILAGELQYFFVQRRRSWPVSMLSSQRRVGATRGTFAKVSYTSLRTLHVLK
ncbi:TPA: hypothetical protein ACP37T_003608 [Pseudomonas aeruginosa]